jgi:hypothetical protein
MHEEIDGYRIIREVSHVVAGTLQINYHQVPIIAEGHERVKR